MSKDYFKIKNRKNVHLNELSVINIFYLTGLFPTQKSPYGGSFIIWRLIALKEKNIAYKAVAIHRYDNYIIRLIKFLFKRIHIRKEQKCYRDHGIEITFVNIKFGLSDYIAGKIFSIPSNIKKLKKEFKKERYTIIHSHWTFPEGYFGVLLGKKFNVPCVITAHGSDIHTLPFQSKKIKHKTLYTLNSANKVIFVSNFLLRKAKELGYHGKNAVVIPNGVDTNTFHPMETEQIRKKLGIYAEGKYYVGFVGNLIPVKRADKFPDIFLEIIKRKPDVKFIIIGGGELQAQIEEELLLLKVPCTFTGRLNPEEVPQWMNCFDCLILPSRNEGWPCVVLEAQACGVPVIGSNVGGIPEAVGDGGTIVDEGDRFEERFAEAVCNVLENPPDPEKLRERALEYDWENTVEKEIEVYRSLV